MAYGQSIGAWGISQLDGVQLKIGERYVPPKKITLPISYQAKAPSDIFFDEYDFSLEEAVVEHAAAQRRAREAAELARAEAEMYADSSEEVMTVEEVEEASAETEDIEVTAATASSSQDESSSTQVAKNDTLINPDQPQPAAPFFASMGHDILTPIPISSTSSRQNSSQSKANNASFNLADFEREQDPFDNLEMKTLNDMVELNKVLMGAQSSQQNLSSNVQREGVSPNSLSGQSQPQSAVENEPTYQNISSQAEQRKGIESTISTNSLPYRNEHESVSSLNPFSSVSISNTHTHSQVTQHTNTNPFLPGFHLPPITTSSFVGQGQREPQYSASQSNTLLSSLSSFVKSNPPSKMDASVGVSNSQSSYSQPARNIYSRYSPVNYPPNGVVAGQALGSTGSSSPGSRSRGSTPPPQPLRSSRSTPDVTLHGDEQERAHFPVSHSPPPYVQRRSPPPPRPSSGQTWNRYTPLPSAQPLSSHSAQQAPSPVVNDPYEELSWEAKQLVDSITPMGFSRARTARAVQKFGNDDKQVVDHLCLVNKLMEMGYGEEDSEAALHLNENKDDKAMEYLKLMSQFKQLGFEGDKIKDALIRFGNDEEKSLDYLTGS